jgi:hypothetical protein
MIVINIWLCWYLSLNFWLCWYLCPPKQSLGDILCLLRFLLLFLFFLSFFLSFFRQKFIRHISRRLLNGNQWNFTGMLNTMSRCSDYFRNFQNGHRCHGNSQNAKKLKNTKMIIAGYSPNRNWWNLIGTTSTSKSESVGQTLPQLPWKQKRGDLKKIWNPFIKLHENL